ncbi:MAG: transcriptional regulator NrdR [Oscillospiraceae bacterium]|nr:transcriptional regulator NrdR [Oscillospiraceae bacterium]
MKCPYCGYDDSKVVDSRPADEGGSIRRRRECLSCGKRFTTYETVEQIPLMVIKRDGTRQSFDKQKLLRGMIRACYKRQVSTEALEQASNSIEQELRNSMRREIPAEQVGELVMDRLKALDEVSYVRFASVYRQFKDITTFRDELNKLLSEKLAEN